MLGRLASYLMGGTAPEAEDDVSCTGNAQPDSRQEDGSIVTCAEDGVVGSLPEATLSQVEVEGEDWILIDRNGEGHLSYASLYNTLLRSAFTYVSIRCITHACIH
ncbi:hypothetical protein QAD02_020067 [Eretmocerus hayati]|uniref:Uncharacterized protein n=1 Tax=Eretmocerus hayati TaxID=131215 RepID=A0ACC2PLI7_9HYME|nr:hypothetical protein QAD02_020067 [Eretmocerus hayati]